MKCAECKTGPVPSNKTVRRLQLCWGCYAKPEVRVARRKKVGKPSRKGPSTPPKPEPQAAKALRKEVDRHPKAREIVARSRRRAMALEVKVEALVKLDASVHRQAAEIDTEIVDRAKRLARCRMQVRRIQRVEVPAVQVLPKRA